eukprot:m.113188 g.113188  ORF g.113188 m.113188 type:complete len:52 (-) comp9262_c0_seq2:3360-3515(-)
MSHKLGKINKSAFITNCVAAVVGDYNDERFDVEGGIANGAGVVLLAFHAVG